MLVKIIKLFLLNFIYIYPSLKEIIHKKLDPIWKVFIELQFLRVFLYA